METKDIIVELRKKNGLSQDELAEKVFVTRQAVSRWETGETIPGTETLKLLSKLFNVTINTLLGSPQQLICQCCGMPLEDDYYRRSACWNFLIGYLKIFSGCFLFFRKSDIYGKSRKIYAYGDRTCQMRDWFCKPESSCRCGHSKE